MQTYLRIINPLVSIAVLVLCLIASAFSEGKFKPVEMLKGGIPTYFIAKGLFCSASLFLVGKIVGLLSDKQKSQTR